MSDGRIWSVGGLENHVKNVLRLSKIGDFWWFIFAILVEFLCIFVEIRYGRIWSVGDAMESKITSWGGGLDDAFGEVPRIYVSK